MKKTRNGMSWLDAAKKGGEVAKQKSNERKEKYKLSSSICTTCKAPLEYKKRKNKFCSSSFFKLYSGYFILLTELFYLKSWYITS